MKKKKGSRGPVSSAAGSSIRVARKAAATVLHIDDDPNDAELLEAAMRKAQAGFVLQSVSDGEQAMAYLNGQGVFADRTRYQVPSLVLLDLKMPRATGFEVLKWIRRHPLFGRVPVVILSGSQLKADVEAAYAAGANSYKVKPLGFTDLVKLVKHLQDSWLSPLTGPREELDHFLRPRLSPL